MDIRPIKTDEDHISALHEIERLWGADEGTPEADKLDVLATLVDAYENIHYPIEPLDPVDTIKAHMEMEGLKQSALAAVLGSRARASEVLNRKRPLSLDMILKINREWHIPAEILIQPYHLDDGAARKAA
ncbi:MAG TPA: transcriptional regulator [Rhizobiaceae bacterium]|nr:transcriptional regulator [Rhizobiaceae bacterium]